MKQDKNHRRWMNLLRLFIVFSLLIVYFQNTPVYPALAYSGDYALEFDGVSDFVQLDTALNILGSNWQSTKTISVWVRPTGIAPDVAAIANVPLGDMIVGDHPRWFGIYQANVTPTNQDRIWVWNTDNTDLVGNAYIGIPYTIGEWVHITLVHTNNMLYAYKNGILIGSQPSGRTAYAHTSASTIKLRIGGRETGQLFQGQIDEVRMWNTALTENEIRQDMYRTLAGTESGLAAYYKMSNGTGTILTDDSIHTWDGTLADGATGAGNVPPDGDTATWVTSGAFAGPRNALDFDGTDDYVSVPADISMPPHLTLEAWVYPRDVSAGQKWIVGEVGGAQLTLDGATAQFRINDGTLQGPATATLVANQWQHLAGTYDGSTLRLYVDGVAGAPATGSTNNADQGGIFAIGGTTSAQYNNIIIDEVRLWDSARSPEQIRENIFQTLQGSESGLVAYYRFDQAAAANGSTTLYDLTGNGNHGTLTNMDVASDWVASTAFNTWIGDGSSTWATGNNWSRNTAPSNGDNVGVYNYLASNAPVITADAAAGNLVVAADSVLTINDGARLTVASHLFNHGALTQIQNIDGSSTVNFLGTGNYGGLTIDSDSQDLGATTVTIRGNQDCTIVPGETVQRCFEISSATSPTNASLTFYFDNSELSGNTCSNLDVFHWNSVTSIWDAMSIIGRDCASTPPSIQISGVTSFSPFVLKNSIPSTLTLVSFSGTDASANLLIPALALLFLTALPLGFYLKKKTQ